MKISMRHRFTPHDNGVFSRGLREARSAFRLASRMQDAMQRFLTADGGIDPDAYEEAARLNEEMMRAFKRENRNVTRALGLK